MFLAVIGTVLTAPSDQYSQPSYDVSIGAYIQPLVNEWPSYNNLIPELYISYSISFNNARYIVRSNKHTLMPNQQQHLKHTKPTIPFPKGNHPLQVLVRR